MLVLKLPYAPFSNFNVVNNIHFAIWLSFALDPKSLTQYRMLVGVVELRDEEVHRLYMGVLRKIIHGEKSYPCLGCIMVLMVSIAICMPLLYNGDSLAC